MASKYSMNDRPSWPRRAIVTAGELLADNTLSSRDRSFLLIVQDNVRSAMDETQFQGLVTAIRLSLIHI